MIERLLLEFAHRLVRTIDGSPGGWPIAMFRLDRVGEPRIVGPQLHFQRLPADREHSARAGFDAHLVKPVNPDLVVRLAAGTDNNVF